MADNKTVRDLLNESYESITASEEVFKDYLKTSAWNYKYSMADNEVYIE